MKLFDKPKWLKPEVNELGYHIHLLILVVTILYGLKQFFGHDMLTVDWLWKFYILVLAADMIAHTILQMD